MGYGYIKTNINAMKFDCVKDKDKIIFNHYIMRRENLNRIQNKLPIGQFNMTISSVSMDLNISRSKAQRLINEFLDKNIIKLIAKGSLRNKDSSIYEYITSDTEDNTVDDTKNISDINDFIDSDDTKIDTNSDKSKKENLNIKLNNKDLYVRIIDYLNKTTGKNFKATTLKTINCIKARLNEGFVEEDFYRVIDIKSSQWIDNDMCKFLRPETLFSNKFEGYLNEGVLVHKDTQDDIDNIDVWDIEFEY